MKIGGYFTDIQQGDNNRKRSELLTVLRTELRSLRRHSEKQLRIIDQNGRVYYAVRRDDSRGIDSRYIGKRNDEVDKICECRYLKAAIRALAAGAGFAEVDPNRLRHTLPRTYRQLPQEVYDLVGVPCIEEWLTEMREYSTFRPEEKKFRTKAGWWVRSKSECMLANELTEMGLPYVYEPIVWVNGRRYAPDFEILAPNDYRICKLEHLGMMDEPEYVVRNQRKFQDYIEEGLVMGVDLLVTCETKIHPLEMDGVREMLAQRFGRPGAARLRAAPGYARLAPQAAAGICRR